MRSETKRYKKINKNKSFILSLEWNEGSNLLKNGGPMHFNFTPKIIWNILKVYIDLVTFICFQSCPLSCDMKWIGVA